MEKLIEAALAHARYLREYADNSDDCCARPNEAEAKRWERLAATAQTEVAQWRGEDQPQWTAL
jgi:hypothetical protein